MLSTSGNPETIYDFGGFPDELYTLKYPASGATDTAQQALELLRFAGLSAAADASRGLDHGVWVPLRYLYPDADIPVAQVSVQPSLDAAHHLRVGAALAPLAAEDVLLIGSGHMTHNLRDWMTFVRSHGRQPTETAAAPYVEEFRNWVDRALKEDDRKALAAWQDQAPNALRAHPSPEHFLPLPVAFAAAGAAPQVEHIEAGVDAGVLAMDAYLFWQKTS